MCDSEQFDVNNKTTQRQPQLYRFDMKTQRQPSGNSDENLLTTNPLLLQQNNLKIIGF